MILTMNTHKTPETTATRQQDVTLSIADILKQVDQLCQPATQRKQRHLTAEDYLTWRKKLHARQHTCVQALEEALDRRQHDGTALAEAKAGAFAFRIGKRWIIRLPKAARHSVPGALAAAIATWAFEHGQGLTGGSLSVAALSALFAAFTDALVRLDPQQACVLDTAVELVKQNIRRKDGATAKAIEIVANAARRCTMTKYRAKRTLEDLIATKVLKVVCPRPKLVCLAL
jgi:hypothetical protein